MQSEQALITKKFRSGLGDKMLRGIKITIPAMEDIFPLEFTEHMLKAYKEFLIALRILIDAQIKKIEELEKREKREIKKIEIE